MEKEIMRTGFIDLDKIINLYEPKLIFLAGRPGMGKTTFAINVLANIGLKQNISVLMLNLEESKELIIDRIISKETQVDISKIKSKELNDLEKIKVQETGELIENSKIFIEDTNISSLNKIIELIRKYVNENNVRFIAIDYLQLIDFKSSSDKKIENILRQLKQISKELKITILITSQMSRTLLEREDKRPRITDLKNKKEIWNYADIIMLLYRDECYNENTEKKNIAELIIAKNDAGKKVELVFDGNYSSFANI